MSKKMKKKKGVMTKKTPIQIVHDRFGAKENLISELAGKLERRAGESKGDFKKRFSKVSCKKLLNLLERHEEIVKYGGREGLVDAIHDYELRKNAKKTEIKEDADFKKHLGKKTLGDLLDRYNSIRKRQRKAGASK